MTALAGENPITQEIVSQFGYLMESNLRDRNSPVRRR